MGDANTLFVDGQRMIDLMGVGDNRVMREAHIFLTAGCSRRGQEELQVAVR